jgi:hypothetical protein
MLISRPLVAGSLPLTFLPVAGDDADADAIEAAINKAQGLIIAFDGPQTIPERALNVFMPEQKEEPLQRVAMMSRYLNGKGMGFFAQVHGRGGVG